MANTVPKILNAAWREASIAAVPELRRNRQGVIERTPNVFKRASALAVHAVARVASKAIIDTLSKPYAAAHTPVIGSGHNSTVIMRDNGVLKIIRDTECMSESQRREVAGRLRELIGVNLVSHPELTVPSSVHEAAHPITGRRIVVIEQELVEGSDALLNPTTPIKAQLKQFAIKSLDEMVPNGFAPDVVGARNLFVTNDGVLRLVDTVALVDHKRQYTAFPIAVDILRDLAKW